MKHTTLALILAGVSTAVVAMDFHPGTYSSLKLQRISQKDLTVELSGYVVITGKIEAIWEAGDDGVPMYPSYSLLPDAEAAAKMPTLDDYSVTSIHILNGADALRLAAGPEVAKAFEERQTLRVTAVGTFRLTQVGMGVECSRLHVGAQHSTAYESLYANIPGIKVISPSNGYDAKGLLKQAIRYEEDPVMFMESEQMYGDKSEVPEEEYYIEIGKADVKKAGRDVTIVSFNKMMKVALAAAAELEKENISAEVIDLRTVRPLDWRTILESVKKTNRLVIVEEQWPFGSVSSEISYTIQKEGFDYLDAPIRRITAADAPLHYAPNLVAGALPSVARTVKLVKEVMYQLK